MYSANYRYDFGIGEPVFARQALSNFYKGYTVNILDSKYPQDEDNNTLRNNIRNFVKSTTGWKPNYIVITNGASSAIFMVLKMFKDYISDPTYISVNPYHYFGYTKASSVAGVTLKGDLPIRSLNLNQGNDNPYLIDSPSNPLGNSIGGFESTMSAWDAAYHSSIYTSNLSTFPKSPIMIGSFSKLFGLSGLRLGWVATDDLFYYLTVDGLNGSINYGVNLEGQAIINDVFKKVDLTDYQKTAKMYLDDNRTEFSKLENIFGAKIRKDGMFYSIPFDVSLSTKFSSLGFRTETIYPTWGGDGFSYPQERLIRISLGQDRELTKQTVRMLLARL